MKELTAAERLCLDVIRVMLIRGAEVTIKQVATESGYSKSAAQKHMNALRDKGALRGPKVVGKWALTSAGKKSAQGA